MKQIPGLPLLAYWLKLCAANAGGTGSIPGQGTKIPHALQCSQKIEKKKRKKETNAMEEVTWIKTGAVSTFLSLPTLAALPGDLHVALLLRELPC